jgi:glycosyltransferase involved in cell wall biosynthesis
MHSFWAACACRNEDIINRTVVSIQGLISVINRHYYGHIEGFRIKVPTIRNIYLNDSMQKQRKDFKLRGEYERRTIEMVHNVIGRTDFDKACTIQINPNIKYHFCNETLRGVFYENRWSLDNCRKHSLFVSQYQYPLKGFHHALEAVFILKKRYPDVHLYTTGRNILKKGIKERLLDTRYEKYIRKIIMDFHLENNVTFLGSLNESEMCARFCETHVFVSASSIENSPNSVGEAMLLGVPTVASDVGGVKNMLEHTKEGYVYQADAPYMLAYYIANIFDDDTLAKTISRNSREHAVRTHNKEDNYERIINIYHEIMTERG